MVDREALSRQRVLRAAVALADSTGLAAVTMRKVGDALGVEAMSLYRYVRGKDDLLDGMVDAVFAEIEVPDGDWRTAMRGRATSMRAALARHRWAVGLLNARRAPGRDTVRHHDAVLGVLRAGGFDLAGAAHAFALLDSYIIGFAVQETTLPLGEGEPAAALADEILGRFDTDEFPHLRWLATEHVMAPGYDFGDEFDWGLDLVLDGLERLTR